MTAISPYRTASCLRQESAGSGFQDGRLGNSRLQPLAEPGRFRWELGCYPVRAMPGWFASRNTMPRAGVVAAVQIYEAATGKYLRRE